VSKRFLVYAGILIQIALCLNCVNLLRWQSDWNQPKETVSLVGRFYDPLGVLSPVVVSFKILIQEICESHVDWDQPLEELQAKKWQELITELKRAQPILIPRSYFSGVIGEVESTGLYGFCDASKKAYAAVIYLVIRTTTETYVRLVVSKTRVAPSYTEPDNSKTGIALSTPIV